MDDKELTGRIIGCAIKVHRQLEPGLLESVYENCLFHELNKLGLFVKQQKNMPVIYDGLQMDTGFRLDLFVERKIVVELKAVEQLTDVHLA